LVFDQLAIGFGAVTLQAQSPVPAETKFLRLPTAVKLGSRFGEWQVCLGGGLEQTQASWLW
jgi:hypothetical protein